MAEPPRERMLSSGDRRRRVKLEARRVRRIIRHIELWSVLKFSLLFYFCLWLIFVLAGVLLWSFAESSGTLESIEELVEDLFALDEAEEFTTATPAKDRSHYSTRPCLFKSLRQPGESVAIAYARSIEAVAA